MTINPTLIVPPAAPAFTAWRVSFDEPADVMLSMIAGAQLGYQTSAQCQGTVESPIWQITFAMPRLDPVIAYEDDWIVSDGTLITAYKPAAFVEKFTASAPLVWSAAAPSVAAGAGGTATVTVPVPTSPTGPWTWSVAVSDTTSGKSGAATLGAPVVSGGEVVLSVSGLTVGDTVDFTVTVTDHYGASATSAASAPITVVA